MTKKQRKLIIFGTGDFAEVVYFYFSHESKYDVVAFTADSNFIEQDKFCDIPVLDFATVSELYAPIDYDMFVAVGYQKVNDVRAQKCKEAKAKGYRLVSFVSENCINYAKSIGENCFIFEDNTIQPFVEIGNNVVMWSGNHVGHHSKIGDNSFITSHAVISGGVEIGKNCFIGVNSTIRDAINIADYTVVGAGALIMKNTKEREVYMSDRTPIFRRPSDRIGM